MNRWAVVLAIAAVANGACATPHPVPPRTPAAQRPPADYQPPEIRLYAFERHVPSTRPQVDVAPPSPDLSIGASAGTPIGTVQPEPARLSERHHVVIVRARQLYAAGRLPEALESLRPAYHDEPDNTFIAEIYAKTLYRANRREEAFPIYDRLIMTTDERMRAELRARDPSAIPGVMLDAWLIDAYWKKGTLHMDRGEWDKAAFEISRAYYQMRDPRIVDEALSYLTKAFYRLGQHEIARHYGEATLAHNPNNRYVLPFMDELRKSPAPTR